MNDAESLEIAVWYSFSMHFHFLLCTVHPRKLH